MNLFKPGNDWMCRAFSALVIASFFLFSHQNLSAEQPEAKRVSGKISQVTLYRDRALVTRELNFKMESSSQTITVDNLPESLIQEKVYAEIEGAAIVRAVQVSRKFPDKTNPDEVDKIRQELATAQEGLAYLQLQQKVLEDNRKVLSDLIKFTASSTKSDLNRGVLDAESLQQLTLFSMEQRAKHAEDEHKLKLQHTKAKSEINRLKTRISEMDEFKGIARYEAKVFIDGDIDAEIVLKLKYHVSGCTWQPRYSIRADSNTSDLGLRFSAVVNQATGESWDDVELILSTASPLSEAARPVLTPLRVTSVIPESTGDVNGDDDPFADDETGKIDFDEELARLTNLLRQHRQSDLGTDPRSERDIQLNRLAGQLQQIELQAKTRTLRSMAIDANDDLSSQTYQLEKPVTLDSRRDQQLIQIIDANVKADLYHVATPLLNSFAYRQAQLENNFEFGLLSGSASVYLDDRFVGQLQIPATAKGQKLTLGLGPDPQVRTRRELMDKTDKVQGGNRQIKFDYRLVISNLKEQPVEIRLLDRIPVATESEQISVQFSTSGSELSEDALYQRTLRPLGIMRWDVEVPGSSVGAKAFDVLYSSTLEFDRNQVPTTKHSIEEILADYEESVNRGGGFGGGGVF